MKNANETNLATKSISLSGVIAAVELLLEELKMVEKPSLQDLPHLRDGKSEVLQLKRKTRRCFGRIPQGVKTQAEFFIPIIHRALIAGGGRMAKSEVIRTIEPEVRTRLNNYDLGKNRSNGQPKWHSTIDQARQKLIHGGIIKPGTSKAIWEITEYGRSWSRLTS